MTSSVEHPDNLDECVRCGESAHAQEYDADEDVYVMRCENGHVTYVTDDFEVWK